MHTLILRGMTRARQSKQEKKEKKKKEKKKGEKHKVLRFINGTGVQ
jgi:hypothetical protein